MQSVLWVAICLAAVGLAPLPVAPFRAGALCARMSGLSARQKHICTSAPDAVAAVGQGARIATKECQRLFQHHRWNCSSTTLFAQVFVIGSREAAIAYALASAGAAYAVTAACAKGNITSCGCATPARHTKWAGCSADIGFGARFVRRFLDAREVEGDVRSLMNIHNNRAGRRALRASLTTQCKCHGLSGSCSLRTCWKSLPPFNRVGDLLFTRYMRARRVAEAPGLRFIPKPKATELIYLETSPNYCEKNLAAGSFGTHGRFCNRSSALPPNAAGSCALLCCGRGYNTHQSTRVWQCKCKFHWCCSVTCAKCSERIEYYTCK